MATAKKEAAKRKGFKRLLIGTAIVVPVLASLAFGGYYFNKYNDLKNRPVNAEQVAREEEERIIREVSQLYDVPDDERPQIATVKDKEILKKENPTFFEKAENDDRLLLYQKAQLAILYRPASKQLIKVGPLQIQNNPAKVQIIGIEASRTAVEAILNDKLKDELVVSLKTDAKAEYTETIVVDLNNNKAALAKEIADSLPGARVGTLPEGEDRPEGVDILIIAGPQTPPS